MVPELVQDITVWLKVAGPVAAGGAAAYRWLIRPRVVEPTKAFIASTRRGLAQVETMASALGPNGGASLADSMRRSERMIELVAATQSVATYTDHRPLFRADASGGWLEVNRALESRFGWSGEALAGRGWYAVVHEEDRDAVVRDWQHAVADYRRFCRQFRVVTAVGLERPVLVEAHPMPSESSGRVLGWFGIITEVP